jgi:hypothetical protein
MTMNWACQSLPIHADTKWTGLFCMTGNELETINLDMRYIP